MTREIIVDVLRGYDEVRSIGEIADEIVQRLSVAMDDNGIEAALRKVREAAEYSGDAGCITLLDDAVELLIAALSRPAQEPVAVKPLEWIGNEARSSLGDLYSVQQLSPNVWTTYMNGTAFPGWKAVRSSAMALAQENDNRRAAPQPTHGTSATDWPNDPPYCGQNYLAGLWSHRNYEAMIEDFRAKFDDTH